MRPIAVNAFMPDTKFAGEAWYLHHIAALAETVMSKERPSLSKHVVAVVDGVVRDTHDPTRDGTRCVYGYFSQP